MNNYMPTNLTRQKKWTMFEKQRTHQTESRIYDLNRQIIKVQGQMASQANSTTYIQRTYSGPFQEEEILPKTFYKSPHYPDTKIRQRYYQEIKLEANVFDKYRCKYSRKCQQTKSAAKLLLSCPTLCDSIDGSPPGSPVPGILQARTLEWVAISFSNARKWKVKVKSLSRVGLLATPWTAAYQAPWDFPGKSTGVGCHCLLQLIHQFSMQ